MSRACLFGTQISDISNQEKRNILPTGKKTFISVAFDVKNYYSGIFYSTSTVERVNSLLKKILQTINLAGSCWVPLFPELLLSVLQSIALRTDDVTKTCPPPSLPTETQTNIGHFCQRSQERCMEAHSLRSVLLAVLAFLGGFQFRNSRNVHENIMQNKSKRLLKCKGFKQSGK